MGRSSHLLAIVVWMRIIINVLLVLAGIVVEGTLSPIPLGLLGIILIGGIGEIREIGEIGGVFLLGVLADILLIRPAGLTGGIYLAVIVLLRLYSRKIETERLRYLLPFTGIVAGAYSWYFYREWQSQVFASLIIVAVVRFVTGISSRKYDKLKFV